MIHKERKSFMSQNENNKNGENIGPLNNTGDMNHIREIESMIEKRNSAPGSPVRKYVRKPKQEISVNESSAEQSESTIVINRVGTSENKGSEKAKAELAKNNVTPAKKTSSANQLPAKRKTDTPVKLSKDNIEKSRAPILEKSKPADAKNEENYTPLLTENDDFEIDENPEPDEFNMSGAVGALTSVAKAIIYLVAVLAVSIMLSVMIISVANDIFAFIKDDEAVTVVVPENCDTNTLAEILADAGAIKHPSVFSAYIKFKNKEGEYLPGTYQVSPSLNYDYMIYEFKEKTPERTTVVVTIPEGYSTDQIVKLLVEKGLGTYEGYLRAINEYEFEYKFLENSENFSSDRYWRLDGYLYPDTYYYYSDSTEETVIYKMLENFNNKFAEEYYTRAEELGMTVDELITLASMIQKEVRYADEFGNVSSVFHNRLKSPANFPHLDSDATIVYAIEHETGERPETLSDTSYESPYNTYKCIGLPPGPIANPSIEAIRYAMYPNKTSYYYFVSGPSGRTTFSRTYSEHLNAIAELYG
ncbi:MAG: endolytic transglycosylase MltG [Ruminococcaceae bacterium]|nr:endolytic transglycosylase MltG [Oscillospiraceae bacterium]